MRKVLIYVLLNAFLLAVGCVCVTNAQPAVPIQTYKSWQVKGFAKSALRMNDYQQAAIFLSEWLRRDGTNLKVAHLLGSCHEHNRNYNLAAHLYDSIYNASPRTNIYASYRLGIVNKYLGYYPKAIVNFTMASKQPRIMASHGVSKKNIHHQIDGCHLGIRWQDTISNMGIARLNQSINHFHKETGPIIINDAQIAYGSTLLDHLVSTDLVGIDRPTIRTYSAILDSGTWKGGYPSPQPIVNMEHYDWAKGTYSLDKKRFYASYCTPNLRGKMQCQIHVSVQTSNGWSFPMALGKTVNHPRFSSSQPSIGTCYDPQLEVIYFTSNRRGGAGNKDIWFTIYNIQTQTYSKAQNAGAFINTSADEMAPYYDLTSHQLYFSSDGWTGIGGLDIFSSKGDMVMWEVPTNLGMPLNSSFDDLDFIKSESGKMGFIASNRPISNNDIGETCCDDLFIFSESISTRLKISGQLLKQNMAQSMDHLLNKNIVAIETPSEPMVLANKTITVNTVRDSSTIVFIKQTTTDENGNFSLWVEKDANYRIIVNDSSLLATSFNFSTQNSPLNESSELNIEIAPLQSRPTNNIEIHNIYYEFGSSVLNTIACNVLDTTLLVLMHRFPNITIEIGSHTDDKGGERYNLRLSEKRAEGVVQYLIDKGISPKRLKFKGYGMSHPVAPNTLPDGADNPEGRQQNRRTEFKIVGVVSE